jgi:two-component system, LytTR family, sensor kinase
MAPYAPVPHIAGMTTRRRWLIALAVLIAFTAVGLSRFAHFWLDDLARGRSSTAGPRLIEEMTGAYAGAIVFAVLLLLVDRWPIGPSNWARRVLGYFGVVAALGLIHTSLMWASRVLLFPLAGLGPYDYGLMRYRFPMEFAIQAPNIILMIIALHGWRYYQQSRRQELRAAQLESELNRAQLGRLEEQLQPHFLFNTLNAISSLMYSDAALADRMMGRLSDLLRLTFQRAPDAEVALASELEWLGWYLEIMQLRFGGRLTVTRDIAPDTLKLAVPRLALQPLVENALTHGVAKQAGPATVTIAARRDGDRLRLSVADDGPGLAGEPAAALTAGVGLSNTAARLRALYGDQGRLTLNRPAMGGLLVTLDLPARPA